MAEALGSPLSPSYFGEFTEDQFDDLLSALTSPVKHTDSSAVPMNTRVSPDTSVLSMDTTGPSPMLTAASDSECEAWSPTTVEQAMDVADGMEPWSQGTVDAVIKMEAVTRKSYM